MRLWDYRLLEVLPDRFIVAEWRECIAIKRQWEKGTLKHRLVSYVMNYDKSFFYTYTYLVCKEMINRNIKYQEKYLEEIYQFCYEDTKNSGVYLVNYPEHNDRYLKQCYYNLQEKYDRGIITKEELEKIENRVKEILGKHFK